MTHVQSGDHGDAHESSRASTSSCTSTGSVVSSPDYSNKQGNHTSHPQKLRQENYNCPYGATLRPHVQDAQIDIDRNSSQYEQTETAARLALENYILRPKLATKPGHSLQQSINVKMFTANPPTLPFKRSSPDHDLKTCGSPFQQTQIRMSSSKVFDHVDHKIDVKNGDHELRQHNRNFGIQVKRKLLNRDGKHRFSSTTELVGENDTEKAEFSEDSTRSFESSGREDHESMSKYYNALKGPELEVLKNSEDWQLPTSDKKWPFLLRFPIAAFGIALGLGSQTILWKALCTAHHIPFLHIPDIIHTYIWCLALVAFVAVSTTYLLKCIFYFEAVRREFAHPVRVNFFFAPWIACMFLTIGIPRSIWRHDTIPPVIWCIFMAPVFLLELKVYGNWLSARSARKLSQVANPTTHLSIVGNFVLAMLAIRVGWKDAGIFFWSVGWFFYCVLLVTLYQRLPTSEILPVDLHPVYFLFIAAPSAASLAWAELTGDFGYPSKVIFFFALFQYTLLVARAKFFFGFRFSIAWWAYTFPMTAAAVTMLRYSQKETIWLTQGLVVLLSFMSIVTVASIFMATLLHAFLWKSLFPNDMAIGIHDIQRKRTLVPIEAARRYQITMKRWRRRLTDRT